MENRRIHLSFLIIILAVSSFLNTYGIWFGLPSKERMNLGFGGYEGLLKKKDLIEDLFKKGVWERSEFLDETSRGALPELSPYFNALRTYHPDEQYIIKTISHMNPVRLDFNPRTFIYPPFFFYQVAGSITMGKLLNFITVRRDMVYYMLHPEEMARVYLVGRILIAIMGVGAVFLVYIIGKTLYGVKIGLVGSAIMAVTPIFVLSSHFVKPDIPTTFWATLSFLFSIYIYRTGRLKWYILAGAAVGLSAGSKYPTVLFFLVIITAHLLRKTSRFRDIFTAFLFVGISFVITSPYVILDWQRFFHDIRCVGNLLPKQNILYNIFDATFFHSMVAFKYAVSPLIFFMLLYGIIRTVIEKDNLKFLFLVGLVPAGLSLLFSQGRSTDYVMSGLPIASVLAARYCVGEEWNRIKGRAKKICKICTISFVSISIIVGFCYTFSFVRVMALNSTTRAETSRWISRNIPKGSTIGMAQYPVIYRMPDINPQEFRLIYGEEVERLAHTEMDYYIVSPYEWDFLTISHIGYYFVNTRNGKNQGSFTYGPHARKLLSDGRFEIIKRFGGMPNILGMRLNKNYQICGSLEIICPTFLILRRTE